VALVFQVVGFVAALAGIAYWSVPAALIVGGVTMFVAGVKEQAGQR
jgi:hypothetical protein